MWVASKKIPLPLTKKEWRAAVANGILGTGLSYSIVYWTSQYVPSGLEAIIFGTMPLWTILFGHFLFRSERVTTLKLVGVVIGLAGIVIIFLPDIHSVSSKTFVAMAIMLFSPMVSAVSLLITKDHAKNIHPVTLNAISVTIGVLMISLTAIFMTDFSSLRFNTTEVWTIMYLGTVGTVVTFVVYYKLLLQAKASVMSQVALITPVIAVLLGWIVRNERLDRYSFAGAICVLGGVWIALRRPSVSSHGIGISIDAPTKWRRGFWGQRNEPTE